MTNNDNYITIRVSKYFTWITGFVLATILSGLLLTWVFTVEDRIAQEKNTEIVNLQKELEECRAEATAWYNSSTALSEAIVDQAMRSGPASSVNTDIALAFAIKGHELKCIQPRIPTG